MTFIFITVILPLLLNQIKKLTIITYSELHREKIMIENNASTSLDDHPINTLRIEDIIAFYLTEKNRCKGKYVPLTEDILDRGYSKDFMWTLIRNIRRNEISAILLKPITND